MTWQSAHSWHGMSCLLHLSGSPSSQRWHCSAASPKVKDWGKAVLFHFPSVNDDTTPVLGKVSTMCNQLDTILVLSPSPSLTAVLKTTAQRRSGDSPQVTQLSVLPQNQLWSPRRSPQGAWGLIFWHPSSLSNCSKIWPFSKATDPSHHLLWFSEDALTLTQLSL